MGSQWRYDFGQRTGLDYAGVRASPEFRRIKRRKREAVFADLCTIEREWLIARDKQADEKRKLDASLPPRPIAG